MDAALESMNSLEKMRSMPLLISTPTGVVLADSVLLRQKSSYFWRHRQSEFMPRHHAHPASQFRVQDRRHNFETIVDQVLTALIT